MNYDDAKTFSNGVVRTWPDNMWTENLRADWLAIFHHEAVTLDGARIVMARMKEIHAGTLPDREALAKELIRESANSHMPASSRGGTGPTIPNTCEQCDGTGMVTCDNDNRHARFCNVRLPLWHPDGCHCHAVMPCKCSKGRQASIVCENVIRYNQEQSAALNWANTPRTAPPDDWRIYLDPPRPTRRPAA